MPASRIAFAIGDLMSEIKSLLPRDTDAVPELRLSVDAYHRVKAEIENHYGQQMKADPTAGRDLRGEQFKLGGLLITCVFPANVDA